MNTVLFPFSALLVLLVVGTVLLLRQRQRASQRQQQEGGLRVTASRDAVDLAPIASSAGVLAPAPTFVNPLTATIAGFLEEIGLPVARRPLPMNTFLPGIRLENGQLVVDELRLLYPGDLLHEAGHLAVLEPDRRAVTTDSPGDEMGDEIAAIAWSWAALTHLRLPPDVVFHPQGYKGNSANFIADFQAGRCVGVPLLQWFGLTLDERNAQAHGKAPFPVMQRWLRA